MNCQQFSCSLLGSAAVHPTPSLPPDAQLHLAGCGHCAADLAIQSRVASMSVPPMPAALASRCRTRVNRRLAFADGRLRPHRYIIFGAVLALAAAAGMLTWQMTRTGTGPPIPPSGVVATIRDGGTSTADVTALEPEGLTPEENIHEEAMARTPEPKGFIVQLMPLVHDAGTVDGRIAVEKFHDALRSQLRMIPRLELVDDSTPRTANAASADYRITIISKDASPGTSPGADAPATRDSRRHAEVRLEHRRDDGAIEFLGSSLYDFVDRCSPGSFRIADGPPGTPLLMLSSCQDAEATAALLVLQLRGGIFPAEPDFQQNLEAAAKAYQKREHRNDSAILNDPRASTQQRISALERMAKTLWEPAAVRSAMDLLAQVQDASSRARILRGLRGVKHPELMQPLIDLLRTETDGKLRLEIVGLLVDDFRTQAPALAALQQVADSESRELVRQLARRALYGEEQWREYVRDSLQDTSLEDDGRLEALLYVVDSYSFESAVKFLDDSRVLAQLVLMVPAILGQPYQSRMKILTPLSDADDPAATDILLAASRSPEDQIRGAVLDLITQPKHVSSQEVRDRLRQMAETDPASQIRQHAARAIDPAQQRSDGFGPPGHEPLR